MRRLPPKTWIHRNRAETGDARTVGSHDLGRRTITSSSGVSIMCETHEIVASAILPHVGQVQHAVKRGTIHTIAVVSRASCARSTVVEG